jgi:large subunit ribosomal protein L10
MKSKEQKQKDLNALTEKLNNSKSAMIVGFTKVTVAKDQEFRNQLRDAGASFQVVKNTIARLAIKDSPYTEVEDFFKGMSAIAWTDADPVVLSKAVSKFVKDNKELYSFKAGIVEGRVVDLNQVEAIASLPSKEELIAKLLFVLNAPAQQIVSVINAVPRNLAIVVKQIGDQKPETAAEPKAEVKEEVKTEATAVEETAQTSEPTAEAEAAAETAQETEQPAESTVETEEAPEAVQETEQPAETEATQETVQETGQSAEPKTSQAEATPEAEAVAEDKSE